MPPHQNMESEINGGAANGGKLYHRNGSLNNNPEGKLAVPDKNEDLDHVNLQKRVGLLSAVCLIVGTMIGEY